MSTDFDYARAAQMMTIMQQVANIAPKATSILGLAQRELNELNEQAKAIAQDLAAQDLAERQAHERELAEQRAADRADYEQQQREAAEAAERAKAEQQTADDNGAAASDDTAASTTQPVRRL